MAGRYAAGGSSPFHSPNVEFGRMFSASRQEVTMHSMNQELEILAARVEKLEVQNRRWKLVSAVFVLSGVSLVLAGAKAADRIESPAIHAKTVEAQEFILKDSDGKVYGRLSLNTAGKWVMDGKSVPPAVDQASLQFFNERGDVVWTAPPTPQFRAIKP